MSLATGYGPRRHHDRVAHEDLLPDGADLRRELVDHHGLTSDAAAEVLGSVAHFLRLHADFYADRYKMYGERQDDGASDALQTVASTLES